METNRRDVLTTGAAAAAMAAAPKAFAQQTGQEGAAAFTRMAPFASPSRRPVPASRCC